MISDADMKMIAPKELAAAPSSAHVQTGVPIPKAMRVRNSSSDEWEEFVEEWATTLDNFYAKVRRFGGAGDCIGHTTLIPFQWLTAKIGKIMDHISSELRRHIMSRIRGRDTKPEMLVRRLVYGLGCRYRLHRRDLPGTPDLVFHGRKKVIFVHGCFWHQHNCSRGARPTSNKEFWNAKLDKNVRRDMEHMSLLKDRGWSALIVWECETKNPEVLDGRIKNFLKLTKQRAS